MTIAIIDRYPIVKKGLMLFLTNEYRQCTLLESESVIEFNNRYPNESPDVIILALSQDNISNLEIISVIKGWYDLRAIIFYDEDSDLRMIRSYFASGIHNYLSKQSGLTELSNCITKVLNGETYIDQEVVIKYWTNLQKNVPCFEGTALLSNREYEIAVYLCEGRKTSWIAKKLARKSSAISMTKATIFKKLGVDNVIHLKDRIEESLG